MITQLNRWSPDHAALEANSYAFVWNHPLGSVDYLGLEEQCLCGLDVTKSLASALGDIKSKYGGLSLGKKWSLCSQLYKLSWPLQSSPAGWAWDIVPLKNIGLGEAVGRPMPFFDGSRECRRTVTFRGGCYFGGAVNYAMWGQINNLCSGTFSGHIAQGPIVPWSLQFALQAAAAFKVGRYHRFTLEESQALAFTVYGYTGLLLPWQDIGGCRPHWKQPPQLPWRWEPGLKGDG